MSELFVPAFNFFLLLGLLGYFLIPKLKVYMRERHNNIQDLVKKAELQSSQAKQQLQEIESKLHRFHEELSQLKKQNLADIERLEDRVLVDAKAASLRVQEEAKSSNEAKFDEFRQELKRIAIHEAMTAAQGMLGDRLKESKMQEKVIDQCVKGLVSVEPRKEMKS